MKNDSKNSVENSNENVLLSGVTSNICRYYGNNDCKDFQPHKGILYGLCKSNNRCSYKDVPNIDDIVECEL